MSDEVDYVFMDKDELRREVVTLRAKIQYLTEELAEKEKRVKELEWQNGQAQDKLKLVISLQNEACDQRDQAQSRLTSANQVIGELVGALDKYGRKTSKCCHFDSGDAHDADCKVGQALAQTPDTSALVAEHRREVLAEAVKKCQSLARGTQNVDSDWSRACDYAYSVAAEELERMAEDAGNSDDNHRKGGV